MSTMITHAPSRNLVLAITIVTTAVTTAPSPLMNSPLRHPCSLMRTWRRAMPSWERVKLVNTPTA